MRLQRRGHCLAGFGPGALTERLPALAALPLWHRLLGPVLLAEQVLPLSKGAGDCAGVPCLLAELLLQLYHAVSGR
jgi:hypothetical protein